MLNVKLKMLRILSEEVIRLEELAEQMEKSRDYEKKKSYYKDLALCREEKKKLFSEKLVETLALTKEEMEMAKNYYYKGMTWEEAFENSALYKENYDAENGKEIRKLTSTYKKRIERIVQKY